MDRGPKRILFVDDDRYLLEGLRDALRPHRRRWTMSFASSGEDALSVLDGNRQDVLVSDLRMPGMDGATLLSHALESHPTTVRIVLSGAAEMRVVARAAGVAHRLLSKPCQIGELARVIERSCALQEITARVELSRRIGGASALPSVPRLYVQLSELLASGDASVEDAARIVERDIAMAAKVLQLANSAYFGRRTPISGVREAVVYLGIEALRALVLSAAAFRKFPVDPAIPGFDLDEFERHCTRVARLAHTICEEPPSSEEAFTAGLLHDVGMLVTAVEDREELASSLAAARLEQRPHHEIERERRGVTHAEVGAHLLELWGLPQATTAAVALHHEQPRPGAPFDAVTATFLANALVGEVESYADPDCVPASALNEDYVTTAGIADQLPEWRELAYQQFDESGAAALA